MIGATLGATPEGYTGKSGRARKALFYGAFSKPFYGGGEGGIRTPMLKNAEKYRLLLALCGHACTTSLYQKNQT